VSENRCTLCRHYRHKQNSNTGFWEALLARLFRWSDSRFPQGRPL